MYLRIGLVSTFPVLSRVSGAAAWRTSMSQQCEPKVIPMCDKLSDPPPCLHLALHIFIGSAHRPTLIPSATRSRRGASPIRLSHRSTTKRTDDARCSSWSLACSRLCPCPWPCCCASEYFSIFSTNPVQQPHHRS